MDEYKYVDFFYMFLCIPIPKNYKTKYKKTYVLTIQLSQKKTLLKPKIKCQVQPTNTDYFTLLVFTFSFIFLYQ